MGFHKSRAPKPAPVVDNGSNKCLHGDLDLKIYEARSLPNAVFQHRRKIGISKFYVTVLVPQVTIVRTNVIKGSPNPLWNEHFHIPLAHPVVDFEFHVKDHSGIGANLVGTVKISAQRVATGKISGWFPIIGSKGNPMKPETALRIRMRFITVEENPLYMRGIDDHPDHNGVGNTYFPLRKGSSVGLYQDAHVPRRLLPEIRLDGGKVYGQGKCWEDICYAVCEARHMIYIVGWSVFHKIKLVREPSRSLPPVGCLTLGELLKWKSTQGVRVLLLIWDDKTSYDNHFIKTAGVMKTHDEETRKFFESSSVVCVLAPRAASREMGIKQKFAGAAFTHHQKCVIVDTQGDGNNRKITAFLGGIDLCDGRYDTPEHRLFRDLDTVFLGDFHQPTFPAGTRAPREPWHDLHCRIDGPAACDVLINFEQRWRKAKEDKAHYDALLNIECIPWILSPYSPSSPSSKDGTTIVPGDNPMLWVSREEDPENWHVQIFRSIDSGSLKGFPKYVDDVRAQGLTSAKNLVIDKSIQSAYIQAIRSAQHFIYIESQYFLGSSYAWPSYENAGADHLIPMELALKIASKIRANERFAVYIILPMWPEGDPNFAIMQEILFWQGQTMQMMYAVVARELKEMQITDLRPQDYLNFYCLGKREEIPVASVSAGALVSNSYKHGRFMIYVHAKAMIVDDDYILMGSANMNERSMAGTRDTEIAMGAYQPHHTWSARKKHPCGQIYGYRMSLWEEHLGKLDTSFEEPKSLECVHKVNAIAEDNWRKFASEDFSLLQGHILKYPVRIGADGSVSPLPGHENFLDVGGRVLGTHFRIIPDFLTT